MSETGIRVKEKVLEKLFGAIKINMKDNGIKIRDMDMGS